MEVVFVAREWKGLHRFHRPLQQALIVPTAAGTTTTNTTASATRAIHEASFAVMPSLAPPPVSSSTASVAAAAHSGTAVVFAATHAKQIGSLPVRGRVLPAPTPIAAPATMRGAT